MEKPCRIRTESGLNEHLGRHQTATGPDWATRLQEHKRAAATGSQTLFHKALRGDLFDLRPTEFELLRAGLTRDEALRLEEVEVETRSLFPKHPQGLNMIPGGVAGLKFISRFRPSGAAPDTEKVEEAYAEALDVMAETENAPGLRDGSTIRELWASSLDFRIRATTGQAGRLSREQITFGRIWAAAGWSVEKIADALDGLGGRAASSGQIRALLAGRTYAEIPSFGPSEISAPSFLSNEQQEPPT